MEVNNTFVQLSTTIEFDKRISAGMLRTFKAIASHCHTDNTATPAIKTIARLACRHWRTVKRDIKALCQLGYLKKELRPYQSNKYTLRGLLTWDKAKNAYVELLGNRKDYQVDPFVEDDSNNAEPQAPAKKKTYKPKKPSLPGNRVKDEYAPNLNEIRKDAAKKLHNVNTDYVNTDVEVSRDDWFPDSLETE